MRASIRVSLLMAFSLFLVPSIFAQTNPPPSDPHELVIHQPRTLSSPAERSAAIDLLENARQDLNMHTFGAYQLKASFQTSGASQNEGDGTMEELSNGPEWRWTAQISDASVVRVGGNGHAYGANPNEPVPMRIQEIRAALHWPIFRNAGAQSVIRSANEKLNGKPVTCLLLSSAVPENPAPRAWVEEEYCIDPASGLLQMWSAAPGIYAEYDYEGAAEFNGHTLPRQISIFEGGALAVQARVESFGNPGEIDPNAFKPGPEMTDAGESFTLSGPRRFPMRVDPSDEPPSTYFQPVIVHATLDAQEGRVIDAEALQNSNQDLSRAALELVRSTSFHATGFQQEVFINVQFHLPAQQVGGLPVMHSSVHWVIWEHRGKASPRKPGRDAV
ncbi:MAG TPA: hypothetical protein VOA88_14045 [Candidatus Dormibacteraeota bacterium]|nr:hypothetical protein [Candidatus Dormibacteraeota bacterium]